MHTRNLLLVSLLAALYGCQPETPAQPPAGSAMEPPASVAMTPPPAPATEPASTAPASVAEPDKVEPPPVAAAKPEIGGLQLARKNGCLACHAIDKKLLGPAWKDVAAKYRGDASAEAKLADKIAKGGSGVWGNVAMPPNPRISEAERQALAKFVLSL